MQDLHITITHMFQNGTRAFSLCHSAGSIFLRMKSLANTIYSCFKDKGEFTLKDAYSENSDKPRETVRAHLRQPRREIRARRQGPVQDNRGRRKLRRDRRRRPRPLHARRRIHRLHPDRPPVARQEVEQGRRPQLGDRNFATYDCFRYTLDDFREKARVLKDGSFLVIGRGKNPPACSCIVMAA